MYYGEVDIWVCIHMLDIIIYDGMRENVMHALLSKNHDRRLLFVSLRNVFYYA